MKVAMTFSFDLEVRKALAERSGHTSKPFRHAELRQWVGTLITSTLEHVMSEYDANHSCGNCGCHEHLPRKCSTCGCLWDNG
jgi:hypothetical protein